MKMLNKLISNLRTTAYDLRTKKGQALVESIVAISIITVGLLGTFNLLSRSLSLNRMVSDRYIAANLGAEGIETVKNLIDNNLIQNQVWNNGINNGIYEILYSDTTLSRQITANADDCAPDYIKQNANFLTFNGGTNLYGYEPPPTLTTYKRAVCIKNLPTGEEIQVKSIVVWACRVGGNFNVNLEDHFFNWR